MSYCSRSCRRWFTVLNFKSWAFSRICGHCQQHFTAHAQERGYLGTSGKSFGDLATFSFDFFAFYMLNVIRFSNPDFLTKCEISAIWRYFPLIFLHFISWKFAVFLLPFYFTYTAPSLKLIWPPTAKLLRSSCWYVAWPCDLDQLSYMAVHVVNTAIKLEDPMPIRSWAMSYNVFHWLGLLWKMRLRLLRMRRITWPVRWG